MALQESIDNFKTLSSQNGELIGQNTKLLNKINELAEPMQGKQWIVDAINEMGGNASMEDSLYTLGEKIEQLVVVSPDTTFTDDVPTPINLSTIAVQPAIYAPYVKHVYSDDVTTLTFTLSSCESLNLPNAVVLLQNWLYQNKKCKIVKIGNTSLENSNMFVDSVVEVLEARNFGGTLRANVFTRAYYIIDFITGDNIKSNISFSSGGYNPTIAYSKTSASLCHDTDIERYGQTFATNWDKWKWCIINHLAANLLDRSGMEAAFTITFGSTVLAQFDEEMIAAFTDKNWTLA